MGGRPTGMAAAARAARKAPPAPGEKPRAGQDERRAGEADVPAGDADARAADGATGEAAAGSVDGATGESAAGGIDGATGEATAHSVDAAPRESLAERYRRIAGERFEPRTVDAVLRALDVTLAGSALTALSPVIATAAAAIRLTSGKPVLYRGARVGRAGRIFTMYKFRTLAADAETRLGPYLGDELTRRTELEVTGLGRALRASHLDELPQLFNVVRGDMSLVGPRPVRPAFFEELCAQIPQYWQRLVVRPGMTGFAQMRLTREHPWSEKLAHDLEYIADRSVPLYALVLLETAWHVARTSLAGIGAGRRPPPSA